MARDRQSEPSFSRRRKWTIGFNVLLATVVVFMVVVMLNYASRDLYGRFHWSSLTRAELAPLTRKFLQTLTNQVKVTIYYDRKDELYGTIADLLNEYRLANPHISVQTVDYIRDLGLAQEVMLHYQLGPTNTKDVIIFECVGRTNPPIIIQGAALAKAVKESVPTEEEFRRRPTLFLGERVFTSVLIALTNPNPAPLTVYFLQDHQGEHPIELPEAKPDYGYLKFVTILAQYYIQVRPLSLLGTNPVPADCKLLVVPGPWKLSNDELEKIEGYLNRGGARLLALFNANSVDSRNVVRTNGLERVLAKWGIEVGDVILMDPDNMSKSLWEMVVDKFSPDHPAVAPLVGKRLFLYRPRSVGKLKSPAPAADVPRVDEIAFTGPATVTSVDPRPEHKRVYPLAVAAENAIKGVTTEQGPTRILAIGDSLFLCNKCIESVENRLFAAAAVNWLLDRNQLLEIGPRQVNEYRLVMTHSQMRAAQLLLQAGLPGAVLLLGGLVWLRRRR
jgi:ABC-type uncharacterized transport system